MRAQLFKFLALLIVAFSLTACPIDVAKVSDESEGFLKREAELHDNLVELSRALEQHPTKDRERLILLEKSAQLFYNDYLNLLDVLQKDALKPFARVQLDDVRTAFARLSPKALEAFRAEWKTSQRPLIENFLNRNTEITLPLTPWAYAKLRKQTEDIKLLKRELDSFTLQLPEAELTALLTLFYTPEKNPTNKVAFTIHIESDTSYYDTTQECRVLVSALEDADCRTDVEALCTPQMDLSAVAKLVGEFKTTDCRERKTSYFKPRNGELTLKSKFVRTSGSLSLEEAMRKAISSDAVLVQ